MFSPVCQKKTFFVLSVNRSLTALLDLQNYRNCLAETIWFLGPKIKKPYSLTVLNTYLVVFHGNNFLNNMCTYIDN